MPVQVSLRALRRAGCKSVVIFGEDKLQYEKGFSSGTDSQQSACSGRVLLVDDNVELLGVVADVLKMNGLDCIMASSAEDALETMKRERPDVIVCDVMMPDMNGHQFHQAVCENPDWCAIPFVFLTALSGAEEVRMGKSLGCDDYLAKPFDPDDLVAVIRGKLKSSRVRSNSAEMRFDTYRRRIINTLSHEFRTPLVAINTGTELLLDQHSQLEQDRVKYLLESIQRGGQRLQRLVEDFMVIQQIESGVAAANAERYCSRHDLVEIVRHAVDQFQEYGGYSDFQLELIAEESCSAVVEVYEVQVLDIINRLLSNAAKFGGEHGVANVRVYCKGDMVCVSIRDYGPGMSEDEFFSARETFAQIDRERMEQQGCGLGLTVMHYFAELNGAEVICESPEEGGLGVEIRFPRCK